MSKPTDTQPETPPTAGLPDGAEPGMGTDAPEDAESLTEGKGDTKDTPPDEATAAGKARKQAASYRERLRASETQVSVERERADRAETQVLDLLLGQAGLDRRLWTAAGVELPRAEDGSLDVAATLAAAEQVRAEFGVARSPQPNPQQGQPPGAQPDRGLVGAFDPNPPRH